MDLKISKILQKDLLSGKSRYVKDGRVKFDCIKIQTSIANKTRIELYLQGVLLSSMTADAPISSFSTFTFILKKGNMEMSFIDESDLGFRERIEAAITEIQEVLDEEKEI